MIEYNKVCSVCGKKFVAYNHAAKLCSDDCRKVRRREIYQDHLERMKEVEIEKKQRKKNKVEPAWVIKDKAKKLGISYGYYVALYENNNR